MLAVIAVLLIAIPLKAHIPLGGKEPTEPTPVETPVPLEAPAQPVTPPPAVPAKPVPYLRILMYHEIGDGPNGLFVSVKNFEEQMKYLHENGYCGITLAEGKALLEGRGAAADGKPVILTFDDGYASFMNHAYPVLTKYGFKATVFIIVNRTGTPNYLTWEQIGNIAACGMEIGSHTKNHPSLPALSAAALDDETAGSKAVLEEKLGQSVASFCYPAGEYNQQVVDAVRRAGYQQAVTVKYGWATPKNAPLEIPRIRISRYLAFDKFVEMFAPVQPAPKPSDNKTTPSL